MVVLRREVGPGWLAAGPRERSGDGRVACGVVTPGLGAGGAEQMIRMLLRHCDPDRLEWLGVWMLVPHFFDPWLVEQVREVCPVVAGAGALRALRERCDVLFAWGVSGSAAYLAGGPARVVFCSQGADPYFTREALADTHYCDGLTAVSRAAVRPYPEELRGRVRVLWNGAERERVRPRVAREAVRARWGVPEGAVAYGCQSRLSVEKGLLALVDALPHLPPEWHLVIAGEGAQRGDLLWRAGAVGAADRLHLPGLTEDVGSFLGAVDVYAAASPSEGCSLALNEALLAGVPAVSTAVGLLEERPELARVLPPSPTGADVAAALRADREDAAGTGARVREARGFAERWLTEGAFGEGWTAYLCEVGANRCWRVGAHLSGNATGTPEFLW